MRLSHQRDAALVCAGACRGGGHGHFAYMRSAGDRTIEVCRTIFDHGIDTLLIPIFGPAVAARGPDYQPLIEPGLRWFASDPAMVEFYDTYEVRVQLYGDGGRIYPEYAGAWDAFEAVAKRTAHHRRHRLFYGACADDPTETVAALPSNSIRPRGSSQQTSDHRGLLW